jgi:hypothetical protein
MPVAERPLEAAVWRVLARHRRRPPGTAQASSSFGKILGDEPGWVDVLRVKPIEFDERATSQN